MTATLPYELEHRATPKLGLIVLQADETLEQDARRLVPDNVKLYVSRVPSAASVSSESLQDMADHLTAAAALMPPPVTFDCVGYGCTSGTAQIGVRQVAELVQHGCQAQSVTEPVSALLRACRHLGIKRLAFLSPYIEGVSKRLRDLLRDQGIETPVFGSFNEPIETNVANIDSPSLIQAAKTLAHHGHCDALFMSCTNLRTLDVIAPLETALNMPVLSSNQVLLWDMMRQSSVTPSGDVGCLFT